MERFKMVSKILDETFNCSMALNAYESPARPFKNSEHIKKNWDKMIKGEKVKKEK